MKFQRSLPRPGVRDSLSPVFIARAVIGHESAGQTDIFAATNAAQSDMHAAKAAAQGADFTGVWYPFTGNTLGAGTADNPGQQSVWLDAQGKPMRSFRLLLWARKSSKRTSRSARGAPRRLEHPDFKCFPSGVPRIYLFLYPMEIVHTPGRVLQIFEYGHNIRQIYTDGRGHEQIRIPPGWAIPSANGKAARWWSHLNQTDKTWFSYGGMPHSEDLRVTERISRRITTR